VTGPTDEQRWPPWKIGYFAFMAVLLLFVLFALLRVLDTMINGDRIW
jgi:hypothetical protein